MFFAFECRIKRKNVERFPLQYLAKDCRILTKGDFNMEKEKKLKIAVTVLAIIAILEFLVIMGDNNSVLQTDGDTSVGYVEDNSIKDNEIKELTDDEIKKNIQIEYAGTATNGDFVLKVTNNNDKTVMIDSIDTIFKDDNDTFVQKETTYNQWFGIQPKKTIYVYDWGFQKDFSKYSNYEFNINLATSSYILESKTVDNFELTANDSGEQIAVEVKNNNEFSIKDVQVNVVYYKDDKVVGIVMGTDIMSNATASQGTTYINVDYPEDSNYKKVPFDNYEVCFISTDIVK